MFVKLLVLLILAAILAALFTSAVFLVKDGSNRRRTLTSLKLRVALSVSLILFILLAYSQGWIQPHGVGG